MSSASRFSLLSLLAIVAFASGSQAERVGEDAANDQAFAPLFASVDILALDVDVTRTWMDDYGWRHDELTFTIEVASLTAADAVDVSVSGRATSIMGLVHQHEFWTLTRSSTPGPGSQDVTIEAGTPGRLKLNTEILHQANDWSGAFLDEFRVELRSASSGQAAVDGTMPRDHASGEGVFVIPGNGSVSLGDVEVPAGAPVWTATTAASDPPMTDVRTVWIDEANGLQRVTLRLGGVPRDALDQCEDSSGKKSWATLVELESEGDARMAQVGFSGGSAPNVWLANETVMHAVLDDGEEAYLQFVFDGPPLMAPRWTVTSDCAGQRVYHDEDPPAAATPGISAALLLLAIFLCVRHLRR